MGGNLRRKDLASHCTIKLGIQTAGRNKALIIWFSQSHNCTWPVEQSSILSANRDCQVARQNLSFLATAHDCEFGLLCIINIT